MTLSPLFLRHCTWHCSLYRFTKFGRMAFRCLLLLEAAWCAKWTATRSFFGHTSGSAVWKGDSQFGPFGKVFFAQIKRMVFLNSREWPSWTRVFSRFQPSHRFLSESCLEPSRLEPRRFQGVKRSPGVPGPGVRKAGLRPAAVDVYSNCLRMIFT